MSTELPSVDMTVDSYFDWWLERHVRRRLAWNTQLNYRVAADSYRPHIGHLRVGDVTSLHLQVVVDARVDDGLQNARTVALRHTCIAAAFGRLVRMRVLSENPARDVELPRLGKVRSRALTRDETVRFLDEALATVPTRRGQRLKHIHGPLLSLVIYAGLRSGEARGLEWGHVDLWPEARGEMAGLLHVAGQIVDRSRAPQWEEPKSVAGVRDVPICTELRDILLLQQRQTRRRGFVADAGRVFQSRDGKVISSDVLVHARREICRAIGMDRVVDMTGLRHTFASRAVEAGVRPGTLAKVMGHSDTQQVMVYYDVSEEAHEELARGMQLRISGGQQAGQRSRLGA